MIDWKRKLTSRKFWACVADFVGMLLIALHVAENTATQTTALIMAGAGIVAYILGEGMTDAAGAALSDHPSGDDEQPAEELPLQLEDQR